MFGFLRRPGAPQEGPNQERFRGEPLDLSHVEKVLATPAREDQRTSIHTRLKTAGVKDLRTLVDRVILRLAAYVWDLPASQSHHHARPFGLLDHSLQVALSTLIELVDDERSISADPRETPESRREWIYVAFIAGLFHDLGKILDSEVVLKAGLEVWNPYAEPLGGFLARNGEEGTTSGGLSYRKGRRDMHRWHGPLFYSAILPDEATARLGTRLALLSDAFMGAAGGRRPEHVPEPAWEIVKLVQAHDIESSRSDREGGSAKAPDEVDWRARFQEALEKEVVEGRLRVNEPSGLVVGRSMTYLERWQGLECVVAAMERLGTPLAAWWTEGKLDDPPTTHVFREISVREVLGAYPNNPSGAIPIDVIRPGEEAERRGYVVLRHGVAPEGLPIFEGRLVPREKCNLEEDGLYANPVSVGSRENEEEKRSLAGESYGRRVKVELDPDRLFETLREAIRRGAIRTDLEREVQLFVRPDMLWVVYGGGFRALAARLGLAWNPELGDRMVEALGRQKRIARWKGEESVLVEMRCSPTAKREWLGVGIPTRSVYSEAERELLRFESEEVEVVGVWRDRASEWNEDAHSSRYSSSW